MNEQGMKPSNSQQGKLKVTTNEEMQDAKSRSHDCPTDERFNR